MNKLAGTLEAGAGAIALSSKKEEAPKDKNIDIERQAEANRISMEQVEAKKVQQEGFANRLNEIRGGNQ